MDNLKTQCLCMRLSPVQRHKEEEKKHETLFAWDFPLRFIVDIG